MITSQVKTGCPTCKQGDIVRVGFRKDKQGNSTQMYYCKSCKRKFTANGALPGRRVPSKIVGDALAAYYDGLSYRDIQRRIEANHGFKPAPSSVYRWLRHYVGLSQKATSSLKADTGSRWVADEMMVDMDGKKIWLWSCMDSRSRYLLATHISTTRTKRDATALFRKAQRRASNTPKEVLTDGLRAYQEGIEQVFGGDTRHVVSQGIRSEVNNNLVERLNGTIRERTKVMRGMETERTARIVVEGFMLHYNHMRPHHALDGRTPAEAAGLPPVFRKWEDVASLREDGLPQEPVLIERPAVRRPFADDRRVYRPRIQRLRKGF